jgi:hypothetical protein
VKDCLKQMTKLHKSMGDDDFVLWDFSWWLSGDLFPTKLKLNILWIRNIL